MFSPDLTAPAALFSAISTAFIIESLKDLKPDYTESSAKALLAISQKLNPIASAPPSTQESDLNDFSPPHASVVVNVLWLLSLSLSVAVSLIAMLAKEWCYKFMSGRSGQIYEQGRRRQQKWNGMERWKMQEVLTYLPGLMHIALLLFAVGLCIYLWDVNIGVAIPITAVTSVATCVYTIVTILPWFDQFCPYSTPVTSARNIALPKFITLWEKIRRTIFLVVYYAYPWLGGPEWLRTALVHLHDWLHPESDDMDSQSKENEYTPMDAVTSQMLAWMIANCEDSHSVNVALQAISGARAGLPHAELAKNGALEVVYARLQTCVQKDASSGEYHPKNTDALYPALRYGRAYSMLASGDTYKFGISSATWDHRDYLSTRDPSAVAKIQADLITYADKVSVHSSVLAIALTACVELSHSRYEEPARDSINDPYTRGPELANYPMNPELSSGISVPNIHVTYLATLLSRHISSEGTHIPEPALLSLLESLRYYMIRGWSQQEYRRFDLLPSILVCIFLMSRATAPAIAQTISITLAATAFAVDLYPGGEWPAETREGREKRAVQVLRHYQKVKPTTEEVDEMFTFGLIGLLPHMSIGALKVSSPAILSNLHYVIMRTVEQSPLLHCGIFTLPQSSYNWSTHLTSSHENLTQNIAVDLPRSNGALFDLLLLRAWKPNWDRSSVPTLILFCSIQSNMIEDACIDVLVSTQPIADNGSHPFIPRWEDESLLREDENQLRVLLRFLFASGRYLDFIATFYFKLLMATTMLRNDIDLSDRQSRLKPLVSCHDEFKKLTPALSDSELPSEEKILEQVTEQTGREDKHADQLLRTMQLVVDFCHTDPDQVPHPEPTQAGSEETANWVEKLQKIKYRFDSTLRPNLLGAES